MDVEAVKTLSYKAPSQGQCQSGKVPKMLQKVKKDLTGTKHLMGSTLKTKLKEFHKNVNVT